MMGFGMGFGVVGLLLMILFWGLLIAGAIWLIKAIFPGGNSLETPKRRGQQSSREILDHRYARGEISREQYETMKKDIEA